MSTKNKQEEKTLEDRLQARFPFRDLEFRAARAWSRNGKYFAQMLCYISSRAVMTRLDDVFGTLNWSAKFVPVEGGMSCQLTANGVTKEDAAEGNPEFPVKGPRSDSLKRAAVHFGIGRYLYELGESENEIYSQPLGLPKEVRFSGYVKLSKDQKQWVDGFVAISLPEWALLPEDQEMFKAAVEQFKVKPPPRAESVVVAPQAIANVIASTVTAVTSPTEDWPYRYKPDFDTSQRIKPHFMELRRAGLAKYDDTTKPWTILTKQVVPEWQAFASNVAAVTSGGGVGKTGKVAPPKPAQTGFEAMPDVTTSVDLTAMDDDDIPF